MRGTGSSAAKNFLQTCTSDRLRGYPGVVHDVLFFPENNNLYHFTTREILM